MNWFVEAEASRMVEWKMKITRGYLRYQGAIPRSSYDPVTWLCAEVAGL